MIKEAFRKCMETMLFDLVTLPKISLRKTVYNLEYGLIRDSMFFKIVMFIVLTMDKADMTKFKASMFLAPYLSPRLPSSICK